MNLLITLLMIKMAITMRKLLLVGDKPSKKNQNPEIAFLGTQSYKRIEKWLQQILSEEAEVIMINRIDPDFSQHLIYASLHHYRIIALGEEAAKALNEGGITNYFKMPHPSGRNRKLNNKKYEKEILQKCKLWIEES